MQELNSPPVSKESIFRAKDILECLSLKYSHYLKSSIVAARIIQSEDTVWLEITEEQEIAGYLKDQKITRTDLSFIVQGEDNDMFKPKDDIRENARKFVEELDIYSLIMTTDLFHESACKEINIKFNPHNFSQ